MYLFVSDSWSVERGEELREAFEFDRLDEVRFEAGVARAEEIGWLSVPGDRDESWRLFPAQGTYSPRDFVAVHHRPSDR